MSLCPLQTPDCDAIVAAWVKSAASAPVNAPALAGTLYKSDSGWILLSVPNAIVRGLFSAMHEPGIELPLNSDGQLNAHISVIRPEELEQIGGAEKINERGKQFYYQLGPMQTVVPAGWEGMSRVWFVQIKSPALERLRKSYGLTALPKNNEFAFHLTVCVRRKGILYANETSKAASASRATQIAPARPGPGDGRLVAAKIAEDGSQLPGEKLKDLRDGKPNTDPEPPKPTDLTMTRQLTPEKVASGPLLRALSGLSRSR